MPILAQLINEREAWARQHQTCRRRNTLFTIMLLVGVVAVWRVYGLNLARLVQSVLP